VDEFFVVIGAVAAIGFLLLGPIIFLYEKKNNHRSFRITEGRIQAPDSQEWRDMTEEEITFMNENLELSK
jgi:hypothetical protein